MKFYVYRVEKINNYVNKGESISYDYTKDFIKKYEELGYVIQDNYVTDSELDIGNVYFNGVLIRVMSLIATFDGEPMAVVHIQKRRQVAELKAGAHFIYGNIEWIKLDNAFGGCLALAADTLFNKAFDDSEKNNWACSSLRATLQECGNAKAKLLKEIKLEDLIEFDRDLTSDDGMTDYGTCKDMISLLTCDEYRKYRKFIPKVNNWYWLITAYSTEINGYLCNVRFVYSEGILSINYACYGNGGVRPLCVLKPEIEVEQKC